jgi:hypothetical protein
VLAHHAAVQPLRQPARVPVLGRGQVEDNGRKVGHAVGVGRVALEARLVGGARARQIARRVEPVALPQALLSHRGHSHRGQSEHDCGRPHRATWSPLSVVSIF